MKKGNIEIVKKLIAAADSDKQNVPNLLDTKYTHFVAKLSFAIV